MPFVKHLYHRPTLRKIEEILIERGDRETVFVLQDCFKEVAEFSIDS